MPLPPIISCFIKIQNGLLFWCWFTQVVLEKSVVSLGLGGATVNCKPLKSTEALSPKNKNIAGLNTAAFAMQHGYSM